MCLHLPNALDHRRRRPDGLRPCRVVAESVVAESSHPICTRAIVLSFTKGDPCPFLTRVYIYEMMFGVVSIQRGFMHGP